MTYPRDAASLLDRVRDYYSFEDEGGPLRMCRDFLTAQDQIALAVASIDKTLAEFDAAGKPSGYSPRLWLGAARASLCGGKT